jgi:hypothetical protein
MRFTEEQYADYQRRQLKQGDRVTSGGRSYVLASKPNKKSKFKNIRCQSADGKNFASRLERDYYEQLLLRRRAGDVLWFIRQPRFDLEGGVVYVADFLVVTSAGNTEVVDTKGQLLRECANKLKQMKARFGIEVQIVRKA